jgi:sulfide dehydrogenase [flavocytochrome c] flavoprotein subunit
MVAHMLKNMNPTAKILVADPKENFSKQGLFEDGWERHYPA